MTISAYDNILFSVVRCDRLKSRWSWVEIFPVLTLPNKESRFIAIEILRELFKLSESSVIELRRKFLGTEDVFEFVLKYHIEPQQQVLQLAADCPQVELPFTPTKVSSVDHVSLPRLSSVSESPLSPGLVSVASTRHNLECVGTAVSVGQPVLLLGDVGVGKTSLVMEWAARTGQKVVTLQVPMTIRDHKNKYQLRHKDVYLGE